MADGNEIVILGTGRTTTMCMEQNHTTQIVMKTVGLNTSAVNLVPALTSRVVKKVDTKTIMTSTKILV